MAQKSAAEQVREAVWRYAALGLAAAVIFGGGIFLGYQMWGAGDDGQPALLVRAKTLDEELNRVKNEREDCKKVLEVTLSRKQETEKKLADLRQEVSKAKAAPAAAAAP